MNQSIQAIHAVDKTHAGVADSSVMYIPACPLTETNARYLVRQREAFLQGERKFFICPFLKKKNTSPLSFPYSRF